MEEWLKSKTSMRIISIVAAVLVWLYAIVVLDPEITVEIDGIPVSYLNYTQFEKQGMRFVGERDNKVKVMVTGKRSIIAKTEPKSFNAVVDLNGVNWPGSNRIPIKVAAPDGTYIKDTIPSQAFVSIDKFVTESFPIEIEVNGTPKEGYFLQSKSAAPDKVTVTGPSLLIDSIDKVTATVDLNEADGDINATPELKLLDAGGKPIVSADITKNTNIVLISCAVYKQKELAVQANIQGTVNDKYMLAADVQPKTLIVVGPAKKADAVSAVSTQPVEVGGLRQSKDVETSVILPDGFKLAAGQSGKILVKLSVLKK